ncbi:hypothetical protein DERF_013075 [Dermatophagoides farinae]|uniref:Uncharacterized protein n=1 Tax=Dermatophagoides farinae TaxID=6954 RepID=A0A922HKZ4_DERFA|nr:hypothetical protein DERF_013075 [Dermatophagoides farinae]
MEDSSQKKTKLSNFEIVFRKSSNEIQYSHHSNPISTQQSVLITRISVGGGIICIREYLKHLEIIESGSNTLSNEMKTR